MHPKSKRFLSLLLLSVVFRLPTASSSFVKARPFVHSFAVTTQSVRRTRMASSSSETPKGHAHIETEEMEAVWDPVAQIYVGGRLPENAAVTQMIKDNQGALRLFGYGSLCWNPGSGPLADPSVTNVLGRAVGYRRCWAQRSTDHRGDPAFPGIVCTLLKDAEFRAIRDPDHGSEEKTLTEGLIYTVPPELADECLEDLDFREKGGYARDIIEVVADESGNTVKALLYRGTPDNPAFWPRALKDLPFAAAVMTAAKGPSGMNEVYLNRLDDFLENGAKSSLEELAKFDDTIQLAAMEKTLRNYKLHFLFGCGSNQHNQLLLASESNAASLVAGEDAHEMKDIVLCTPSYDLNGATDPVQQLFAGGGHSAILTESGRFYLFGWNESGQLGSSGVMNDSKVPIPLMSELKGVRVETAALGFNHSLVVEKDTGRLYTFGDNGRGQLNGKGVSGSFSSALVSSGLPEGNFVVDIAAGLFHSAAITNEGQLITFGCDRFGQSLPSLSSDPAKIGRWRPDDGSKLVRVACGRRHTTVLDDKGRILTLGENKYGQLGRSVQVLEGSVDGGPHLTTGLEDDWKCYDIQCGWSHNIVLAKDSEGSTAVFGWGRNDKGQLGTGTTETVLEPTRLFEGQKIESVSCGSESTVVVDESGNIWCCGWNEHGNLSTGSNQDSLALTRVVGAPMSTTPGYPSESRVCVAAGGAHVLAMKVPRP